jgi:hypothetical protein
MTSIAFDSFGYMALSENIYQIYLCDSSGNSTGLSFSLSVARYYTAVDANGRFIISNSNSIGIYY